MLCGTGTYFNKTNVAGTVGTCIECVPGRYMDTAQHAEATCKPCPVGKYTTKTGREAAGECDDCPAHKTTADVGSDDEDKCYCTGNYKLDEDSNACMLCNKGEYFKPQAANNMGVGRCEACGEGLYMDTENHALTECKVRAEMYDLMFFHEVVLACAGLSVIRNRVRQPGH